MWLRELRILCKLCKLWTERRSSRSSRVDLNALITRSCKNREGRSIRKRGGKPATHKHAIFSFRLFFFFFCRAEEVYASYRVHVCMFVCTYVCTCVRVCHVCIPLFHVVAVRFSFRFPCVLCTCYQRIPWFSRGCSRGCCLAFRNLQMYFSRVHLFYHFYSFVCPLCLFLVSSNFLSLHYYS